MAIDSSVNKDVPVSLRGLEAYDSKMKEYIDDKLSTGLSTKVNTSDTISADKIVDGDTNVALSKTDSDRLSGYGTCYVNNNVTSANKVIVDVDKYDTARLFLNDGDVTVNLSMNKTGSSTTIASARSIKIILVHPDGVTVTFESTDSATGNTSGSFLWCGDHSLSEPEEGNATDIINAMTVGGAVWYMSLMKDFK